MRLIDMGVFSFGWEALGFPGVARIGLSLGLRQPRISMLEDKAILKMLIALLAVVSATAPSAVRAEGKDSPARAMAEMMFLDPESLVDYSEGISWVVALEHPLSAEPVSAVQYFLGRRDGFGGWSKREAILIDQMSQNPEPYVAAISDQIQPYSVVNMRSARAVMLLGRLASQAARDLLVEWFADRGLGSWSLDGYWSETHCLILAVYPGRDDRLLADFVPRLGFLSSFGQRCCLEFLANEYSDDPFVRTILERMMTSPETDGSLQRSIAWSLGHFKR